MTCCTGQPDCLVRCDAFGWTTYWCFRGRAISTNEKGQPWRLPFVSSYPLAVFADTKLVQSSTAINNAVGQVGDLLAGDLRLESSARLELWHLTGRDL